MRMSRRGFRDVVTSHRRPSTSQGITAPPRTPPFHKQYDTRPIQNPQRSPSGSAPRSSTTPLYVLI
ncbi:hypothetical protein C8R44DRAFT_810863 [Mycena epipterygia]|nr:hypothetical protein C8R44DRAFT_810863 [Mycena epipterygia]